MDPFIAVLLFFIGAIVGGIVVWVLLKQTVKPLRDELAESKNALTTKATEAGELAVKLSAEASRREAEAKAAEEKLAVLQQAEAQMREAFKALSSDALRNNNESFLKLAKESLATFQEGAQGDLDKRQAAINQLVTPVRESLEKVDEKIQSLEKVRAAAYEGLQEQIKGLLDTHKGLRVETSNLVKALREPQVRGRWGELQLRRCVEYAGMVQYCDFSEQENVTTEGGKMQRPDMIVRLPNGRNIVIDAKMTFDAFGEAIETDDVAQQKALLQKHARQVRDHLKKLGEKAYWKQFEPTPEFVVLFLPTESFFSAALEQDPSLIEYGSEQRVILATPTTLIALLKAVAYGWRQEEIAAEARAISDLGREIYERLGTFAGHFAELGKNLGKASDAYNKAIRGMESRVLVTARKFKDLKVSPDKDIPPLQPIEKVLEQPSADELKLPDKDAP